MKKKTNIYSHGSEFLKEAKAKPECNALNVLCKEFKKKLTSSKKSIQ